MHILPSLRSRLSTFLSRSRCRTLVPIHPKPISKPTQNTIPQCIPRSNYPLKRPQNTASTHPSPPAHLPDQPTGTTTPQRPISPLADKPSPALPPLSNLKMPHHIFSPTSPSYTHRNGEPLVCTRCKNEPGYPPLRSTSTVHSSSASTFSQTTQATLKYICKQADCTTAICEQCLQEINTIFKPIKVDKKTHAGGYYCKGVKVTRAKGWEALVELKKERMKRREEVREEREGKGKGKEKAKDENEGENSKGKEKETPRDVINPAGFHLGMESLRAKGNGGRTRGSGESITSIETVWSATSSLG